VFLCSKILRLTFYCCYDAKDIFAATGEEQEPFVSSHMRKRSLISFDGTTFSKEPIETCLRSLYPISRKIKENLTISLAFV
jgi:hypothetical protein